MEVAAGAGHRGPWQQNESDFNYVDDPSVALWPDGTAAVTWVDQQQKDVFLQVYKPDGTPRLAAPVNVSRTPGVFSWLPRVAVSPSRPGEVFVLWQEIVFSGGSHGGDIFFARSVDGGATFDEPINLSNSRGGDGKGRVTADHWDNGSLDLAIAGDGSLYAAWTEYHGMLWFSRSSDGGRSFSRPLQVAGEETKPARAPALAAGAGADLYLAWTVGEDDRADIRVAKSTDGGRSFGSPKIVAQTQAYSDAPKLAVGERGTLHVAFREGAGVRYTRSLDGGETFERLRRIADTRAFFPALSLDAAGNVYILFEISPGARRPSRGLALTLSTNGGDTFSEPKEVPGSADPNGGRNGSQQGMLMRKIAVTPGGGIAVVNTSFKPNEKSRVWMIRGELQSR